MPLTRTFRFRGTAPFYADADISVDGVDLPGASITGITMSADVGEIAEVILSIPMIVSDVEVGNARVVVGQEEHELLVKLGWTPPEQEVQSYRRGCGCGDVVKEA